MFMPDTKTIGVAVILVLLLVGIFLLSSLNSLNTPEANTPEAQIKAAAERWGTGNETAASGCKVFASLDEAKEWFGFPGEWKPCYEENRWTIFYDPLEAFITCKLINGKYVCCAGAHIPDYNGWKVRCE